jgi:hypothetical protein
MEQRPVAPDARAQEEGPTADWAVPVLYLDLGFLADRADSALRIAQIIRESDDPDRPTPAASTIHSQVADSEPLILTRDAGKIPHPILWLRRIDSDLPAARFLRFQYLSTDFALRCSEAKLDLSLPAHERRAGSKSSIGLPSGSRI